jgi:hypothetical protein
MSARKDAIHQALAADHAASLETLKRLTPEQWTQPVPSEEDAPWTARDVLAHLAISEAGHVGQITRCVAGEAPVPDDFDLRRYNRGSVKKRADKSPAELIAEIEAAYQQLLDLLDRVAEPDLDKTGRHARGDVLSVEQFFRRCTEHRRQHAEELKQAVKL